MYTDHHQCRACGYARVGSGGSKSVQGESLIPVFDLGLQPLANDFVKNKNPHAGFAPLKVMFCPRCTLAQLSVNVDPDILYANYPYVTSDSATMRLHFDGLICEIMGENTRTDPTLVEIGSNDGLFLEFAKSAGCFDVVGIDPAENLSEVAAKRGVKTIVSLFDEEAAKDARKALGGQVDIVVARHCFCHINDWKGFVKALKVLCSEDTLVCLEVPYVKNLLERVEFDTIYHEHTSYLSIKAMQELLDCVGGLHMHHIVKHAVHGGAITIMLRSDSTSVPQDHSVYEYLKTEEITVETWQTFAANARRLMDQIQNFVHGATADKKTVVGYGASAKSTVLVNACGFTRQQIRFITDTTPAKQYCTCPGTDIPITDPGAILRELPDYVIIFAWNYADEILEKESLARSKGVKFLVPVPELRELTAP